MHLRSTLDAKYRNQKHHYFLNLVELLNLTCNGEPSAGEIKYQIRCAG